VLLVSRAARLWYGQAVATVRREIRSDRGESWPELWADEPLGEGWTASFRLDWTGTEFVLGELRVTYSLQSADYTRIAGYIGPAPPGLTARRLRKVSFEAAHQAAREELESQIAEYYDPEDLRRHLEETRLARGHKARSARRNTWTDAEYVSLAARYVAKVRDGAQAPVAELAAEYNYAPSRIRQALAYTRKRGWLTPTTQRRAGGTLTDEALRIAKN
jgi:hypothetical protein